MANNVIGFSPNWLEGQQNAGLGVYIATGIINGILVNGQVVTVPANSTTQIWVTAGGAVQSGSSIPGGAFGIAQVVSGQVLVGGNTVAGLAGPLGRWAGLSYSNGILSITDIR